MKFALSFALLIFTCNSLSAQQSERLRLKLSGNVKTAVIYRYQSANLNAETFLPVDTSNYEMKMYEYFNEKGGEDSTITYAPFQGGKTPVSYYAVFLNDSANRIISSVCSFPQSIFRNDGGNTVYTWREHSYTRKFYSYRSEGLKDSVVYYLDSKNRDSLIYSVSFDTDGIISGKYAMDFVYFDKDSDFAYSNTYTNLIRHNKYVSIVKNMSYDESGNPTHICFFNEDKKTIQSIYWIKYYYYE